VAIAGLTRQFRTRATEIVAIDRIDLKITGGSAVAVTGPSGSGKSTLLHLIGAITPADTGRIDIDGVDLTALTGRKLAAYRRTIGFVFQRFHLLPALTALDNVTAPVLPLRTTYNKTARARELLAAVGLGGRESALPAQLSGGQQQRVAVARALIAKPRLLLADEPTGNLDSTTGAAIMDLLVSLQRQYGMTLVIATHEQHIAERCDRVIGLVDGRIVTDTG
jgi:putative ABC transport system ATP-binding protein